MKRLKFNNEMVRAMVEGRKNQTRRIIKDEDIFPFNIGDEFYGSENIASIKGDLTYEATNTKVHTPSPSSSYDMDPYNHLVYTPSDMPYDMARIFGRIESISVEKLRSISEEDARGEGVTPIEGSYREGFKKVWDSIYGKHPVRGWDINPMVYVIRFKDVEIRSRD